MELSNYELVRYPSGQLVLIKSGTNAQGLPSSGPKDVVGVFTSEAEARVKGYEGESCRECGNFTLVRNGTCLKCDTCGGTSGCS